MYVFVINISHSLSFLVGLLSGFAIRLTLAL